MSLIFWDTMVFIYWIEQHPEFGERVDEIRHRMWERRDPLATSTLTIGELLSGGTPKATSNWRADIGNCWTAR